MTLSPTDSNNPANNNNDENNNKKLSPTEAAIIEMMKQQNLEAQQQQQQEPSATTSPAVAAPATTPSSSTTTNTTTVVSSASTTTSGRRRKQKLEQQGGQGQGGDADDKRQTTHHSFWDTQPMPHGHGGEHPEGPIVENKARDDIRQEPYAMPAGFEWSLVDVSDKSQLLELYNLLSQNYVEDDEALFRFDYSQEFLLWALTPPDSNPDFIFGVRTSNNNKLVAFISGVPAPRVQVYNSNVIPMVEINYLCVHKKLRSKRLAPVLIKEMTRRVNLTGVFQAVYTAGTVLPVPVSSARYHHRSLNPKKLVAVGFSRLSHKMTMARMQKMYKLPDQTQTPGLRPMEAKDVPAVHHLLNTYMSKFQLKVVFSEAEVAHWILPRDKVIHSFVVEQPDSGKVTDLISFYHLPSSILKLNDTLHSAYSYYNVATSVSWVELMKDALILAKQTGSDVFNALNLMDNDEFLEALKFGLGDGHLQYYIYNWACPPMPPSKVGIVLV